jgi:protein involved in polysaccharide export with SLBB domain
MKLREMTVLRYLGSKAAAAGLSAACLLLAGCAAQRAAKPKLPVQPAVVQSALRFEKEYLLTAGDQIEVNVRRFPEVTRTVMVRPDGMITLPLINDVAAAGHTTKELAAQLTKLFAARLVEPEVAVIALQTKQPMVYVTGDVNTPGAVPFGSAPTAMQAVSLAGGLRRSAASRDIALIRLDAEGFVQAFTVPVESAGQPGPYLALASTVLRPDDIIFVPESNRSQFSRFLDDIVNRPLAGINGIIGTYANFRIIQVLSR